MLMDNGRTGVNGRHAAKLAEEELRQDAGDVIPRNHMEVAEIALENRRNHSDATQSLVLHVKLNNFYFLIIN